IGRDGQLPAGAFRAHPFVFAVCGFRAGDFDYLYLYSCGRGAVDPGDCGVDLYQPEPRAVGRPRARGRGPESDRGGERTTFPAVHRRIARALPAGRLAESWGGGGGAAGIRPAGGAGTVLAAGVVAGFYWAGAWRRRAGGVVGGELSGAGVVKFPS